MFKNISTGREDILKKQTELLEVKIWDKRYIRWDYFYNKHCRGKD